MTVEEKIFPQDEPKVLPDEPEILSDDAEALSDELETPDLTTKLKSE